MSVTIKDVMCRERESPINTKFDTLFWMFLSTPNDSLTILNGYKIFR